ncbi:hypothetical protein [Microbacterium sp. NPDC055521]
MNDHEIRGIVTTRRDDVVADIARQAPPMSESVRGRVAQLLAAPKPVAS